MQHDVFLFGPQAKLAGTKALSVQLKPEATAADVLTAVARACPTLVDSMNVSRLAINHEFASAETVVAEGDELALIGMVSGG